MTWCGDDLCVTENPNQSLPTTSTIAPSTSTNQETTYSAQYTSTDQLASVRTQSNTWLPRTSQTASTSMQASHPDTLNSHHVDILSTHLDQNGSKYQTSGKLQHTTAGSPAFTLPHLTHSQSLSSGSVATIVIALIAAVCTILLIGERILRKYFRKKRRTHNQSDVSTPTGADVNLALDRTCEQQLQADPWIVCREFCLFDWVCCHKVLIVIMRWSKGLSQKPSFHRGFHQRPKESKNFRFTERGWKFWNNAS